MNLTDFASESNVDFCDAAKGHGGAGMVAA
jgi:hypothetical protein